MGPKFVCALAPLAVGSLAVGSLAGGSLAARASLQFTSIGINVTKLTTSLAAFQVTAGHFRSSWSFLSDARDQSPTPCPFLNVLLFIPVIELPMNLEVPVLEDLERLFKMCNAR
jgi:hypothetical protein